MKKGVGSHPVHEHEPLRSISPVIITLQAALKNSSHSSAPTVRFWLKLILLSSRPTVESLKILPVAFCRERRRSETVAAGRSLTSSSGSLFVASSVLGDLPPPFLGSRGFPQPGDPRVELDGGEADAEETGKAGL